VKFWEDVWLGNNSIKSLYPRLFTLSLNQGLKVNEVGEWVDAEWRWTLRWRRDIFEWESLLETNFIHYISRVRLSREQRDVLTWGCKEVGCFTVSSVYEFLAKRASSPHQEVFKSLWKIKAFPNVIITAWRVLLGRVPSRMCLRRRGVMLNTILCAFCQTKEESCQHIFIECPFNQRVWTLCFKWIGIMFVQHNKLSKHFENFYLPHLNNKQNLLWKGVWATIVRCIWDHRNSIVFKQGVVDGEEILMMVQLKSWQWLKHKGYTFNCSFADWILNPIICIRSSK